MGSKIFITGSTGFIGSNLANRLAADGHEVYGLSRDPSRAGKHPGLKCVAGELAAPETYRNVLEGCDEVYHCAAAVSFEKKDFDSAYRTNVDGTRVLLEQSRKFGVKNFIHLSSCAVLGYSARKDRILDETSNPDIEKDNVYAYTKKLAEQEAVGFSAGEMSVFIANIATVYGPRDAKLNSGTIIKLIFEGKMKFAPPGGTSFVSVDDLVEGLVLLAKKGHPKERYIFCSENMEYLELARRIANVLEAPPPRFKLPPFTYYPALAAVLVAGMISSPSSKRVNVICPQILKESYGYKYFDSSKAKRELGWTPKENLETAVRKAFLYYKDNGLI